MRQRRGKSRKERAPFEPEAEATITRIQVQRTNSDRCSVYLDEAFAFGVYQDVVVRFGLRKGQKLTVAEQREILAADQVHIAMATALHYLGYKPRTEREVRRKLDEKDLGVVADRTIARLNELGYLDDASYAHMYVESRLRRGYGPRRIRMELRRRGVANAQVEEALEEVVDADDRLEAAREQAARRWPRLQKVADPRRRRKKLYDFLLRRGFGYDLVRQVTDELERESSG